MVNARGYLFICLNAVRVLSIISLILLFSSSILTMVDDIKAVNAFVTADAASANSTSPNPYLDCSARDCDYIEGSTVPNQPAGAFWAVLNSLLVVVQSIVCILSELSWPDAFFEAYFPVLGPSFGLGALGVIQCLLGAAVLSHHVEEFPLVSAFLVFSVGCLNILLGLIFRERAKLKRNFKKWQDGARDILPVSGKLTYGLPNGASVENLFSGSFNEKGSLGSGSLKAGYGFGRAGEKLAASQGYAVREPAQSVPPYASKAATRHSGASSQSEYTSDTLHEHAPQPSAEEHAS